jgi:hypothetical protein
LAKAGVFLALCLAVAVAASAEANDHPMPPLDQVPYVASASRACTAAAATTVRVAAVARDPEAFEGKCVRVEGFWRDSAIYPTRAEAAQPDALSIPFLDQRRLGLDLQMRLNGLRRQPKPPTEPTPAVAIGTVWRCAGMRADIERDVASGYCTRKIGAALVLNEIAPAN